MKKYLLLSIVFLCSILFISCNKEKKISNYLINLIANGNDEEFILAALDEYSLESHKDECNYFFNLNKNGTSFENVTPLEIAIILDYSEVVGKLIPFSDLTVTSNIKIRNNEMNLIFERGNCLALATVFSVVYHPDDYKNLVFQKIVNSASPKLFLTEFNLTTNIGLNFQLVYPVELAAFFYKTDGLSYVYKTLSNKEKVYTEHYFFICYDNEFHLTNLAEIL